MPALTKFAASTLLTVSLGLASAAAIAAETPSSEPFELTKLSCWDVITLPEADATFVIALLIGYKFGAAGTPQTSSKAISDAVLKLDRVCADSPDLPAYEVLD